MQPALRLRRGRRDLRNMVLGRLRRRKFGTRNGSSVWRWVSRVTGRRGRAALFHISLRLLLVLLLVMRGSLMVGVLRGMLRCHPWLGLGRVVDGRRGHVGDTRVGALVRHAGSHAARIVARAWARNHRALRSVASLHLVVRVTGEDSAVGDGRGGGGRMMADLGELGVGLAMVLRRHHLRLEALGSSGRGAIAVLVVIIIVAGVEVGRALVFIRPAVLA